MCICFGDNVELVYLDGHDVCHEVITHIRSLTDKQVRFRENGLVRYVPRSKVVTIKKIEEITTKPKVE
jgi:hypothetical protein